MSEQFLATASVRIVPDVTGFAAALQAEITAATRAVKVPAASAAAGASAALTSATRAQTVAQNKLVGSTEILNVTKKQQASLNKVAADAAKIEADALRAEAVAAREAATAHSQLVRGLGTATASQFGLRGAVLASSGPFLAAVVAVETLRKSVDAFSSEQEAAARVNAILGDELGKSSEEWAKQQAAIGLSTEAALKYEGAIAQVFTNVRVAGSANAKFSQELVTRAVDVAARANVPVTQVLRAFQLALSGNLRGLRQFVPGVSAATIAQQAFADTGKTVKANLTEQELVLARLEVLLATSANQAGAFAERQGSLAGQTKILQSNIENLAAGFGKLAAPVLLDVAKNANLAFKALNKIKDIGGGLPGGGIVGSIIGKAHDLGLVGSLMGPVGVQIKLIQLGVDLLTKSLKDNGVATEQVGSSFTGLLDPINQAAIAFRLLRDEVRGATADIVAADNKLLSQQIQGASSAERIATLQAKAAAASTILGALGGPRGQKGRQALQTKAAAVAEIKSIRDADAAAAKAAASAAEAAAKRAAAEAEAARRQHDQDILTAQEFAQNDVALAKLKAQRTKSLVDDVAADKVQIRLLDQQIKDAAAILDLTLRKQTIQALTLAREQAAQQLTADKQAQIQRQKEHRDLIRDRQAQRLELDIEIASTNKAKNAEIKAREARIAFDREQLKSVHGDIVRRKQLQLEIAQDTQAIKDLKKAKQDNMGATLGFISLQTQQGFVSNLLSNLLSTSATAGTVGGTSGAISTPTSRVGNPLPPPGTGFPSASSSLSAASQIAGGPAGASSGQLATLIHVQRQMLAVMLRLVGQRTHPEATHQRTWAGTEMLNTGW